ncbi:hypothetical protein K5D68_05035 [Pseudomonas cichorii]|nr:hypothetical protein [Pseudomonas cichorii]MBX8585091.1 hypothetical protein [Pseudomonas cichorii]MBX8617300.1 hypothetical protein [Pseudomonas cichorii]
MKRIDTSKLKRGDIILSTSPEKLSAIIKRFTNSDISHAMIYVADGSVMDSTGDGVQARNIQKMSYPDECALYVYRVKNEISADEAKRVISYVRRETGAPYDSVAAGKAISKPRDQGSKNQFCSRLIARAYAEIGINLTDNPNYATPAQLKLSEFLKPVEDAVITFSEDENNPPDAVEDTTQTMRDITNVLLEQIRKVAPKVRVLGDIAPTLLAKPGLDKKFLSAYKSSGYLDFWQVEISRFPWRYDYETMLAARHIYPMSDLISYCKMTISQNESGDYDHWKTNAIASRNLYANKPLKTFGQWAILYHNLHTSQKTRLENAQRFLAEHSE